MGDPTWNFGGGLTYPCHGTGIDCWFHLSHDSSHAFLPILLLVPSLAAFHVYQSETNTNYSVRDIRASILAFRGRGNLVLVRWWMAARNEKFESFLKRNLDATVSITGYILKRCKTVKLDLLSLSFQILKRPTVPVTSNSTRVLTNQTRDAFPCVFQKQKLFVVVVSFTYFTWRWFDAFFYYSLLRVKRLQYKIDLF